MFAEDKAKDGDEGLEPQVSTRGAEPRESSHHDRHVTMHEADIYPERQQRYDSMAASAACTARQLAQRSKSAGEKKRCCCALQHNKKVLYDRRACKIGSHAGPVLADCCT